MRPRIGYGIVLAVCFLVPKPAEANLLCDWFNRCLYESPGFHLSVVDKETGQPLADVHALAEWVQYGRHGTNGPLMVQDAISGPDGILSFSAWGPLHGSPAGLALNQDPGLTLFKPGYKILIIFNAIPVGTSETDRVRGFFQDTQTFALEPFRGTAEEWIDQLRKGWLGLGSPRGDEQVLKFRNPYLHRLQKIWHERDTLSESFQQPGNFFWSVEGQLKFLEERKP